MDHFTRLKRQIKQYILGGLLLSSCVILFTWWLLSQVLGQDNKIFTILILFTEALVLAFVFAIKATEYVIEPVKYLWQAILHVSPDNGNTAAPNLQNSKVGRELITSLCLQVYQLASTNGGGNNTGGDDVRAQAIAANLPLPLIVMDKAQGIVFANEAAGKYLGLAVNELIGKNFYEKLNLSFSSTYTLDRWLSESKDHNVTSSRSWERVRLNLPDGKTPLQFDMAAYYNKQNPSKVETIVTLFDHTSKYSQEDNTISFVALAVHELRTPLTLLRGYIEVFEDELSSKLDPELLGFMRKMQASAQQLSSFVNNILNFARIEDDQMVLQLQEETWNDIVSGAVSDLKLRAGVKNKLIELQLASDLPPVAADRVSIYEVLSNLLDNAIKYSADGQKIIVSTALAEGGAVQTSVQDFGVGIATNIVPHLFEKFYRSHQTQQQIGGTGLGLYLSKVIVNAHGGNIWIRSKPTEGTTVGFTLKPYAQLAGELKNSDNKDIVRNAYGWIKNHSLYRR